MKHMLFVAALMAALPWGASAQVEKRVEVTKAYVPSVEGASKLAVVPDMTDTVKMRPEIDYTIRCRCRPPSPRGRSVPRR